MKAATTILHCCCHFLGRHYSHPQPELGKKSRPPKVCASNHARSGVFSKHQVRKATAKRIPSHRSNNWYAIIRSCHTNGQTAICPSSAVAIVHDGTTSPMSAVKRSSDIGRAPNILLQPAPATAYRVWFWARSVGTPAALQLTLCSVAGSQFWPKKRPTRVLYW